MDPAVQNPNGPSNQNGNPYLHTCNILTLTVFAVFFCLSRFVQLQFADSKLSFSIFIAVMMIALSIFVNNPNPIRIKMDNISKHPSRWIRCIFKAFGQFIVLAFVTTLIVWIKYPRYRVSDIQDGCISAISKQGDLMGFLAVGMFSLFILCTSMRLNLHEEFGLFYLSLEYTMNAAVEMPDIGGHMVNWRYVGPAAIYCFLLISVRCYCHSSDEGGRRGGNGGDHGDDDDAGGRGRIRVESQPSTGVGVQPTTGDEKNQQEGGHDAAEGGGRERETGYQGHRKHPDSSGTGSEIAFADEGDDDDDNENEGDDGDQQPTQAVSKLCGDDDGAEGREMGDCTDLGSASSSWDIVSAEEGDEGDEHKDDDDNDGDNGERQPIKAVLEFVGDELRQPDLELFQKGDGDDGAESGGGGGGGIETGVQGHRTDLGSVETFPVVQNDDEISAFSNKVTEFSTNQLSLKPFIHRKRREFNGREFNGQEIKSDEGNSSGRKRTTSLRFSFEGFETKKDA